MDLRSTGYDYRCWRVKRASFRALHQEGCFVLPNPWDLGARSEGFLIGRTDLGATIERLVAYADAGADCLYAPGIRDLSAISEVVSTVAPKPVNALLLGPEMHVAGLVDAGVRRVSTGGGLAAAAWAGFDNALRLLTEKGTLPKRQ